jgi:hypothetical protein
MLPMKSIFTFDTEPETSLSSQSEEELLIKAEALSTLSND